MHVGDDVARLVDGPPGVAGEAVRAARVGEALGEERQHRLDRLGAHRRRRRVVEVDERGTPRRRGYAASRTLPTATHGAMDWRRGGLRRLDVRRRVRRRLRRLVPRRQRRRAPRSALRRRAGRRRPAGARARRRHRPPRRAARRRGLRRARRRRQRGDARPAARARSRRRASTRDRRRHGRRPARRAVRRRARRLQHAVQPGAAERQAGLLRRRRRPPGARRARSWSRRSCPTTRPAGLVGRRAVDDGRSRSCCRSRRTTRRASGPTASSSSSPTASAVRLRPWSIRYAPPAELDAMAAAAGLVARERWEDVDRRAVRRRQPPPRQCLRPRTSDAGAGSALDASRRAVVSWSSL